MSIIRRTFLICSFEKLFKNNNSDTIDQRNIKNLIIE